MGVWHLDIHTVAGVHVYTNVLAYTYVVALSMYVVQYFDFHLNVRIFPLSSISHFALTHH